MTFLYPRLVHTLILSPTTGSFPFYAIFIKSVCVCTHYIHRNIQPYQRFSFVFFSLISYPNSSFNWVSGSIKISVTRIECCLHDVDRYCNSSNSMLHCMFGGRGDQLDWFTNHSKLQDRYIQCIIDDSFAQWGRGCEWIWIEKTNWCFFPSSSQSWYNMVLALVKAIVNLCIYQKATHSKIAKTEQNGQKWRAGINMLRIL